MALRLDEAVWKQLHSEQSVNIRFLRHFLTSKSLISLKINCKVSECTYYATAVLQFM